ncbi:MAG: porin family protein [Flavobacteriaceae bacterium]|jgi:outer membrane protein|nr:porin family protein [Flavobacteriaceae bacterium]
MKKLVLSLVAVAAFGYVANAQEKETFGFEKGNIILEGSISINDSKVTNEKTGIETKFTDYNFNPKAGYFLNDKFAVGLELGFGKEGYTYGTTNIDHKNTTYVGAFARYYFLELGKRFKTYGEFGLGYQGSKAEVSNHSIKTNGVKAAVSVGMNYFITDKFAIGVGLGDILAVTNGNSKYNGTKTSSDSTVKANINVFNNFFDQPTFSLTYKF